MKMHYRHGLLIICSILILNEQLSSQSLENFEFSTSQGLRLERIILTDGLQHTPDSSMPVFSFELNERYHQSDEVNAALDGTRFILNYEESLRVTFTSFGGGHPGWMGEVTFENQGFDTIEISNVVPFCEGNDRVFITGKGTWNLARAWLHRPGYEPVRVILPDNAWELGYTSIHVNDDLSACAIARRSSTNGAQKNRYSTSLPPRGTVSYKIYADRFEGGWQEGLRLMFQERYLYDLAEFDNTLYERQDLRWIRNSYLIALQFAWDKGFYDRFTGKYNFDELIKESNRLFGHLDVYGIWPTWPRLGVDKRNQWDMYENLPGGTEQLRNFARLSRQYNTRFFIAYNPWDQSTRSENHYAGMARLIQEIEADGVVLDTRGSSSYDLQAAADSVREGVVMFSEGMAVTRDMPGIVAGRVHNAIYLSPEINLNKLIKPEFAIFRVCDVGEAPLHREIAIAFFNGYGTELNLFRPGRDLQLDKDYDFLGKTTKILRENSNAFHDRGWTPLIDTRLNKVYINRWIDGEKIIYTVYGNNPAGTNEPVIEVIPDEKYHYVSIWHNEEITAERTGSDWKIHVRTDPYLATFSGTRREGTIDCIGRFPVMLHTLISGDSLRISSVKGGLIKIWKGDPTYQAEYKEFIFRSDTAMRISDMFQDYEGKIVIQLLENGQLSDENIVRKTGGRPWLASRTIRTETDGRIPKEMVLIPGTSYLFKVSGNDDFIPYHESGEGRIVKVDTFLIDRYPVTNQEYADFVVATGYYPGDTANYLRHWDAGTFKKGQEKYPVVYISIEDARAYAKWAGKRLPSETEWHLAAQGTDGRKWPWGDEFHGTKCNNAFDRATPVDAFPKGQSPYGVYDMVGNVWQLTNDVYDNGTNYFVVIRGGSHYMPTSSWLYVQGGPQQLDKTQMLLMVSKGFDRNSTVGFRCVRDY